MGDNPPTGDTTPTSDTSGGDGGGPSRAAVAAALQRLWKSLPDPKLVDELASRNLAPPGTIGTQAAMEAALAKIATALSQASGLPAEKLIEALPQKLPAPHHDGTARIPVAMFLPRALLAANGGPPLPYAGAVPYLEDPQLIAQLIALVDKDRQQVWKDVLTKLSKDVDLTAMASWPTSELARLDIARLVTLIGRLAPLLSLGWAEATYEGQPVDAPTAAHTLVEWARQVQAQIEALPADGG